MASTASAHQWQAKDPGKSISNGTLTISHVGGHYKIAFPARAAPRSASLTVDGKALYANDPYGFSGQQGDTAIHALLAAKAADARYDDRQKTKPVKTAIDLQSLQQQLATIAP
ncbi:hypothetical protein [Serratia odorifera]|uniref:hypothetical protein n=1 Tax=Serratia odorifera TaxID=618 RepID=UPI0002E99AF7|nr:hypothetical protein [Serratia odorifera]MBJ2066374.1 hypothetical protein [Serratia odorifera]PNK90474.1 hypothetical protein CEQ31_012620 [Serratia odorifera]RII71580.1 hypothetical protein DX901_13710 [Serratia odorifera]